ncbi:hypothetical protein M413DRAFT_401642 [Hebeloma cylindrosporum]|uniref:F-box domain-containing protein n=1 Tax=Hebeloma cylindrosporum TaxID=76867 RepID=A0A0C2YQN2_HEBCY|nr:hypothetical protein M413DRAFT_401642 [Hebeloma cylindrosporum h7]
MAEILDPLQDISRISLHSPAEPGALRKPFEPPPEILQIIFELAIPPNILADLTTSFSPNSLWCRVLEQKLSLLNVCWAWYRIGIAFLYENIAIRRIYQLENLLRTLESPDSSYLKDLIKTLDVHCFIPRLFHDSFTLQLSQLFKVCPRITSFSHTSPCYPPCLAALPSLPPTLTHLELGAGIDPSVSTEVLESLSPHIVSLSYTTFSKMINLYSFPRLESLSFVFGFESIAWYWELPRLHNLTLRVISWPKNAWPETFSSQALIPFLKKNGAQLKFFHILPETDCRCISEFNLAIEGFLELCPSLERFVLHPRPVPPITHERIRWFRVGNDIWDLRLPHTSPGHRIVTAPFPSLRTLRKPPQFWTSWNACFSDLKSSFPDAETRIRSIQQCLGFDLHDDIGEIFLYISDMPLTDDAGSNYSSTASSEESDSDSDSESDGEVGSDIDFDHTWDAQMDSLNTPAEI